MQYLRSAPGVTLIGTSDTSPQRRVPTISFIHESKKPSEIVAALHKVLCVCSFIEYARSYLCVEGRRAMSLLLDPP